MVQQFHCSSCNALIQFTSRSGRLTVVCPKCKNSIPVPKGSDEHEEKVEVKGTEQSFWRDPSRLTIAAGVLAAVSLIGVFLSLTILFWKGVYCFSLPLFALSLIVSGLFLAATIKLLFAKQRAISGRQVSILFGLAKLIVWEQNEGLLMLKNKKVWNQIYGSVVGGGLKVIYPVLGEEVRIRAPLTIQLTWFIDEKVLTRDAVQLKVKTAIWWEIHNLEAFFYKIDSEVHSTRSDRLTSGSEAVTANRSARGHLSVAEIWVKTLTESCLRKLISETSTFLIVSKQASQGLPAEMFQGSSEPTAIATPDRIAKELQTELAKRITSYGINIDRIEIQDVQLPPRIQTAVDEVWISATQPKRSENEASALRNHLQVLADVLGKDAAGLMQIVDKMPSNSYLGNPVGLIQKVMSQLDGSKPTARAKLASKDTSPPKT